MPIELTALIILGITVLALLAVASVFGLGLYLGWFSVGLPGTAGKDDFRFTMDADRIQKDKKTVQATVQDLGGQAEDKSAGALAP